MGRGGRSGAGGTLDPGEVLLLKAAVQRVAALSDVSFVADKKKPQAVVFGVDAEEDFWKKYIPKSDFIGIFL